MDEEITVTQGDNPSVSRFRMGSGCEGWGESLYFSMMLLLGVWLALSWRIGGIGAFARLVPLFLVLLSHGRGGLSWRLPKMPPKMPPSQDRASSGFEGRLRVLGTKPSPFQNRPCRSRRYALLRCND